MKRHLTYLAFVAIVGIFCISASAQFTITIPKIPKAKVKKNSDPQNQSDNSSNNSSNNSDSQNSSTNNSPDSSANSQDCSKYGARYLSFLDDITKNQKEVAAYDGPENNDYYFSRTQDNFAWLAISKSLREKWWVNQLDYRNDKACNKIDPALDELANTIAKTIHLYVPGKGTYAVRNPREEALMKGQLTDLASLKVLSIGLASANWTIETNSLGIPTSRYKWGRIYAKPMKADDPYCRIIYINVAQQYAGGGTYGATYGYFVRTDFAGCPAGQ